MKSPRGSAPVFREGSQLMGWGVCRGSAEAVNAETESERGSSDARAVRRDLQIEGGVV